MKWKVEYITGNSCNVLLDDPKLSDMGKEPVGMGFPKSLAERLVTLHNESLENMGHAVANAVAIFKQVSVSDNDGYIEQGFSEDVLTYLKGSSSFYDAYIAENKDGR